jgi:hypothetical protein
MSTDPETIFEKPTETPETPDNDGQSEPNTPDVEAETLLATITRDDGTQKYKDVPSALEALKESQKFIGTLTAEQKELRAKVEELEQIAARNITMEELMETIKNSADDKDSGQPPSSGLTTQDIEQLVSTVVEQRETSKLKQTNQKAVADKLIAKFGTAEKAAEFYDTKAREIGVSVNWLNDLAGQSATAALELLGVNKEESKPAELTKETVVWRPSTEIKDKPVKSPMSGGSAVMAWRKAGEKVKAANTN